MEEMNMDELKTVKLSQLLEVWESFTGWYWFVTERHERGICFGLVSAVTQNHPPGVESKGFKITHPEKVKGLAKRLGSGADFGHVKLSQDGLDQRNSGTQKQRLVEAAHRPGAPDRSADGAQIYSGRFKFSHPFDPRHRAG